MADTQTYQPDLYDLVTAASFAGDVEWYVRKAKMANGPVLELGAGTGRVTGNDTPAGALVLGAGLRRTGGRL